MKHERCGDTDALRITTAEGTYVLYETDEGYLNVHVTGAKDAHKHHTSLLVLPRAANSVHLCLEPRSE